MNRYSKMVALLLIISLCSGLLAGCGKAPADIPNGNDGQTSNTGDAPTTDNNLPIDENSAEDDENSNDETIPAETDAADPEETEAPQESMNPEPVTEVIETPDDTSEAESSPSTSEEPEKLDDLQRNSIAMLNHLTVLTREISASKGSRLYLEQAYSSLINNTYPNAVDIWTESEIDDLLDTLEAFRMISVKRERLQYIYDHNKAKALRSAIPNPISILNTVQSGSLLKSAVSVLYMAVDSYSSYQSYNDQLDLQFLQDGWALDDEESGELHTMRRNSFTYMINMVREYSLPGDLALNEEAVDNFVQWESNSNVVSRISILESNQSTYEALGSYWLALAKSYYENGDFEKCLDAVAKYNLVQSRIFRRDLEYAETLPYAILSAKEVYKNDSEKYVETAASFASEIISNTSPTDWSSHYFVALVYMDLYARSQNQDYLNKAYQIALNNVILLTQEQTQLNTDWLNDIVEVSVSDDASKEDKEDAKQYNNLLKEERKIAVAPISEPLYVNCELLFDLASKLKISDSEKSKIDSILHDNEACIFLNAPVDNYFRYGSKNKYPAISQVDVAFDGEKLTLPAYFLTEDFAINVTVSKGSSVQTFSDWKIDSVKRVDKDDDSSFTVTCSSKKAKDAKYENGAQVSIQILPRKDNTAFSQNVRFNVKQTGIVVHTDWNPFKSTSFERVQ